MITVKVGSQEVQFPDGTPREVMEEVLRKNFPPPEQQEDTGFNVGRMVSNIPESGKNLVEGIIQPILHPIETAKGLQKVGQGLVEKVIPHPELPDGGEWGKTENEEIVNSIGGYLKERYGGVDNLLKTIETDPVGFGADVAGIATGGAVLGAKALKAASLAKAVQKAGETIAPLKSVVDRVGQRYFGKSQIKILDETGNITPAARTELQKRGVPVQQVMDDITEEVAEVSATGLNPAQQAEVVDLFKRHGVDPNRFNVTQRTSDAKDLMDEVKRSGPVSEQVAKQEGQIIGAVERGVERLGPSASNIADANNSVGNVIRKVVTDADEAVSQAYRKADEVAGKQFRVTTGNLLKEIQNLRGPELHNPVITQAIHILENRGVLKSGRSISSKKGAKRVKEDALKPITAREAEGIRQELNQMWDSVTPQGRRVITRLKDALDDDVEFHVAQKDIFNDARAAKQKFHKLIERGKRDKFDTTEGGLIESFIENRIPQEQFIQKAVNGRSDDLKKLRKFLTEESGPDGVQAWNDLRAQVLRDALEAATSTAAKAEGGQVVFNANKFRQKLAPILKSGKRDILFDQQTSGLIDDISKIGRLRIPQGSVASGSGPTGDAVASLAKLLATETPGINKAQKVGNIISDWKRGKKVLDVEGALRESLQ